MPARDFHLYSTGDSGLPFSIDKGIEEMTLKAVDNSKFVLTSSLYGDTLAPGFLFSV
jgi:hypothetical protein